MEFTKVCRAGTAKLAEPVVRADTGLPVEAVPAPVTATAAAEELVVEGILLPEAAEAADRGASEESAWSSELDL